MGVPETITTDRGCHLFSYHFHQVGKLLGVRHIRTSAYHPAANGMVEHHRQLKSALMTYDSTNIWIELLPMVLLGSRAIFKVLTSRTRLRNVAEDTRRTLNTKASRYAHLTDMEVQISTAQAATANLLCRKS